MKRLTLVLPLIVLIGCDVTVDRTPDVAFLNMPGMAELGRRTHGTAVP